MTTLTVCTLFLVIIIFHKLYSQNMDRKRVMYSADRRTDTLSKSRENEMYITTTGGRSNVLSTDGETHITDEQTKYSEQEKRISDKRSEIMTRNRESDMYTTTTAGWTNVIINAEDKKTYITDDDTKNLDQEKSIPDRPPESLSKNRKNKMYTTTTAGWTNAISNDEEDATYITNGQTKKMEQEMIISDRRKNTASKNRGKEINTTDGSSNTDSEYFEHQNDINNRRCRVLPDVLIFGFDKCGTMTLRQFLSVHPDIFITHSEANNKFFKNDYRNNESLTIFKKNNECTPNGKLRLEKLVNSKYPENVHKYVPQIKLIAIVKEPTERAMSHFVHMVVQTDKPLNMDDFDICARRIVNSAKLSATSTNDEHNCEGTQHIITTSMYATSLKKWIDVFGVDKILIIDGDNFVANPAQELRKAEQFIGLEPKIQPSDFYYDKQKKFYCIREEGRIGCMSEKKGRPHPAMENSTRRLLKDFFKPYNEEFYKLIGRTFPWDD